jgi:hypothetical protein
MPRGKSLIEWGKRLSTGDAVRTGEKIGHGGIEIRVAVIKYLAIMT